MTYLDFADRRFTLNVVSQIRLNSLTFSTMSYITPTPIQAPTLREWVLSKQPNSQSKETESPSSSSIPKTFKIVDVRDDDYVGGHIPGTLNIPSRQLPSRVDSLVEELKDNEAIVFTCALSQQRGPNVF
jgi:hypothetical protein